MTVDPRPLKQKLDAMGEDYEAENVPLAAYAALMGTYAAVFGGLFLIATRGGRRPKSPRAVDLAYLTLGAYKLSRIVTMSFIGSPLRAPFTTRGKSLKGGEVQDQSRGEGLRKAVGNLLTCPFCFNVWSNTLFLFGFSIVPRLTLQAARILSMAAMGDVLHHGYRTLREKSE